MEENHPEYIDKSKTIAKTLITKAPLAEQLPLELKEYDQIECKPKKYIPFSQL